ncbi:hypothetical protein [Paenibacillus hubeiensis]|uniref:hypothetical protein n=1 Tax=Paenibacillus hubeiensis TaxID=3077330 RepID=UPI0031BA4A13
MRAKAIGAADAPAAAQTADRTNPRYLLCAAEADAGIIRRQPRSGAASQTGLSRWGEQLMQQAGEPSQLAGYSFEPIEHDG